MSRTEQGEGAEYMLFNWVQVAKANSEEESPHTIGSGVHGWLLFVSVLAPAARGRAEYEVGEALAS